MRGTQDAERVDGFFVQWRRAGLTIGPRERLMGIQALPTYP